MWSIFSAKQANLFHIRFRALQFSLRLFYFILIYLEAERVFYHFSSISGIRVQYSISFSLGNNVVAGRADVDGGEKVVDIAQPDFGAVELINIAAVHIHFSPDGYSLIIEVYALTRVIEN